MCLHGREVQGRGRRRGGGNAHQRLLKERPAVELDLVTPGRGECVCVRIHHERCSVPRLARVGRDGRIPECGRRTLLLSRAGGAHVGPAVAARPLHDLLCGRGHSAAGPASRWHTAAGAQEAKHEKVEGDVAREGHTVALRCGAVGMRSGVKSLQCGSPRTLHTGKAGLRSTCTNPAASPDVCPRKAPLRMFALRMRSSEQTAPHRLAPVRATVRAPAWCLSLPSAIGARTNRGPSTQRRIWHPCAGACVGAHGGPAPRCRHPLPCPG